MHEKEVEVVGLEILQTAVQALAELGWSLAVRFRCNPELLAIADLLDEGRYRQV